jgi:hypothetical protein
MESFTDRVPKIILQKTTVLYGCCCNYLVSISLWGHTSRDINIFVFFIGIEKVSANVIQKDFEQDEKLFDKLVRLYNEEQTESKEGFTLRDISLQCALNHQRTNIKDFSNIKHRHPLLRGSLQYAEICRQIQAYFSNNYHAKVPQQADLFLNLDMQEKAKIALVSQLKQDLVPYTLYVYLVPTRADIATLGHASTTYNKGGALDYKLLDLLSVNAKHRYIS